MQLCPVLPHGIEALVSLDVIAQSQAPRVEFIHNSVRDADYLLGTEEDHLIGYAVFDYTLFGNGFVSMLYAHPVHRRRGVDSE